MDRLGGLQALRALAALLVLVGHVRAEAEHYFALVLPGAAIPWTRGVDLIFVISGFIVSLSARRYARQPLRLLGRRIWRVVPLYYLFTLLMVAALIIAPGGVKETSLDLSGLMHSLGFLPHARPDGRIAPILSLGWTLNYEVFFYLLVALALTLPRPMIWACLALIGFALPGLVGQPTSVPGIFWTNPITLEFAFGILIARLWSGARPAASWPRAVAVGGIGFALLILLDQTAPPRFLAAVLPIGFCAAVAMPFAQALTARGSLALNLYRVMLLAGLSLALLLVAMSLGLTLPLTALALSAASLFALIWFIPGACAALGVSLTVLLPLATPIAAGAAMVLVLNCFALGLLGQILLGTLVYGIVIAALLPRPQRRPA